MGAKAQHLHLGRREKVLRMAVFWDVVLCSLLDVDRCFREAYCLHHQGDESEIDMMMEAVSSSETQVNIHQITPCNIPEDSHLCTCCHEKLKSHAKSF
jgi:hypothetical protein